MRGLWPAALVRWGRSREARWGERTTRPGPRRARSRPGPSRPGARGPTSRCPLHRPGGGASPPPLGIGPGPAPLTNPADVVPVLPGPAPTSRGAPRLPDGEGVPPFGGLEDPPGHAVMRAWRRLWGSQVEASSLQAPTKPELSARTGPTGEARSSGPFPDSRTPGPATGAPRHPRLNGHPREIPWTPPRPLTGPPSTPGARFAGRGD